MNFLTLFTCIFQNHYIVTKLDFQPAPWTHMETSVCPSVDTVGNATCNPEDGVCPEGCRDGYIGAKCNQIEKFIMPASNDVFDLFDLKLKFYSCLRLF